MVEVTSTETWRDGDNVITIDFSDTTNGFGMRMSVNGKSEHGFTWHHPPHGGGTELIEGDDEVGHYAWFSEYWSSYFPLNTVVRLTPIQKA
jgi:hypothetical protein